MGCPACHARWCGSAGVGPVGSDAGADELLGLGDHGGRLGVGDVVDDLHATDVPLGLLGDRDGRRVLAEAATLLRAEVAQAVGRATDVEQVTELGDGQQRVVGDGHVELDRPLVDTPAGDHDGLATVGVDALLDVDLQRGGGDLGDERQERAGVELHQRPEHGALGAGGDVAARIGLDLAAGVDDVAVDVVAGETEPAEVLLVVGRDLRNLLLVGELDLAPLHLALEIREELGRGRVEQDGRDALQHDVCLVHDCTPFKGVGLWVATKREFG